MISLIISLHSLFIIHYSSFIIRYSSDLQAGVLHGDIPQKTREQTLKDFKVGKFRCLVATDVAARGLDIQGVRI